jgi:aryl sulfotransferase
MIVWLASYPKSGNTWFRVFLTNLLRDSDQPAIINDLEGNFIASARRVFDEAVGYDSGDLTFDEVDLLRPEVYRHQAETTKERLFAKVHDAYTFLPNGRPLFPPDATRCVLYFIRNPLDVCVSLAHHLGHKNFDRIIKDMADDKRCFCDVQVAELNQFRQKMLTWNQHVLSWVEAPHLRVHVVRYEDMKLHPDSTFKAAASFAGLPDDAERVRSAIKFSSFDELRQQEEKDGFGEKMPRAQSFFRKGEIGSWREVLTPAQAQRIVADHAGVMRRFGYLDGQNQPVF